jgi:hypothetical protein
MGCGYFSEVKKDSDFHPISTRKEASLASFLKILGSNVSGQRNRYGNLKATPPMIMIFRPLMSTSANLLAFAKLIEYRPSTNSKTFEETAISTPAPA